MWKTEYSIEAKCSKQAVWNVWADVENWKDWDHGIEYSRLDGEFKIGSTGVLKPLNGGELIFEITEVEPLISFTDISSLPFGKMVFNHVLEETASGVIVTHSVQLTETTNIPFPAFISNNIERELPEAMKSFVKLAESQLDNEDSIEEDLKKLTKTSLIERLLAARMDVKQYKKRCFDLSDELTEAKQKRKIAQEEKELT